MEIELKTKNYIELNISGSMKRDLVLILPGGGYARTSLREANPVSDVFLTEGYHTAIYFYREELLIHPHVSLEGERVLSILKDNPLVNRIFLIGFSAGGHLAATLMSAFPSMVSATVLAYPVITSNPKYMHKDSIRNLLGNDCSTQRLYEVSLEHHMSSLVSPVFIMHTMDDKSVAVENSLLLMDALRKHQVFVEMHLYPKGRHGLSLATKKVSFDDMDPDEFIESYGYIASWVDLAKKFLRRI